MSPRQNINKDNIKIMFKPFSHRLFKRAILVSLVATACAGGFVFSRHADMQERRDNRSQPEQLLPDLGNGASLNGARPFPANNPWNVDVSKYPVHPNSSNLIASIGANTGLHPDFGTFWQGSPIGIPYVVVPGSQQRVPMNFIDWPGESDPGPYPFPATAPIEGGASAQGDRHVLAIDRDNWKLYETYNSSPQNGGASWNASNGAVWDLKSNKLRPADWTSADAAGLPIFPGLVRRDEVLSGEIRHAIRFTAAVSRRAYVYPATHQAGSTNSVNAPPMGLRVRLKSTFNTENPNFSPNLRVILRAMKKYGMILADNGSNWYFSGSHDPLWNDDELGVISQVKGSDFEVVQTPGHLLMPANDFDGDGNADLSIFRPSENRWYQQRTTTGYAYMEWGVAGDKLAPADYDGDGITDMAIWRPSDGKWYLHNSRDGSFATIGWGVSGDIPAPADYDGDGKADLTVFRPSNSTWYTINSDTGSITVRQFGETTDKPVPADYDGDGKADISVFRSSTNVWYFLKSTGAYSYLQWGAAGDQTVPADYDGDGATDAAVFRPSTGTWYIIYKNLTLGVFGWGANGDAPAPADYDGDGKADFAIFRPSESKWYVLKSTDGIFIQNFGAGGDVPTPATFIF